MASPLHKIRKNQKLILGVLGILLMIAFVFGDMAGYMGGPGAGSNEVVVTTNYGAIHEQELSNMLQKRALINRVLGEARRAAFGDFYGNSDVFPRSERAVVQTMVLAKKGEELGMVVSDKVVNDFIRQVTMDRVTTTQLSNIIQNTKVSQRRVFDALAEVILASQVAELSLRNIDAAPPAARWEYFQRLRRQVKAEVLPVPVEQFVSQVKTPSENELTVFFEQHRNQYGSPRSPEPGFKIPPQGEFEYFKADYKTFYDAALAKVSPEEIEKHYEANKDTRYLYRELPDFGGTSATPAATTPADVEKTETPADSTPVPATENPPKTDSATPPVEQSKAQTETPQAAASEQAKESSKAPEASKAPETAPQPDSSCGEQVEEPAAGGTQEAPKPAESAPPAAATPAESAPPAQPVTKAPAVDSPALVPPTTTSTEAAAPAADAAAAAATDASRTGGQPTTSLPAIVMPLSDEYMLPRDIAAGPNPKHQPLWRVEDDIRKELARTSATEQIDGVLGELRQKLDAAAYSWSTRRFSDDKSSASHSGPQVDFKKLAEGRTGITTGKTPLASAMVLSEASELGKSRISGQVDFGVAAFERLATFKPTRSEDTDGNHFLFWKTAEKEARVPELAEVRKEVEHAWKMIKARDLALEKAHSLAAQAQKQADKSLKDSLAAQGTDTVETNSFTWLTLGASPMMMGQPQPRLSEVTGVENAGNDFMRAVYSLDVHETGVAMNYPQNIAYVIRLVEGAPDDFLRTQFLAAVGGNYQSFSFAADIDAQPIIETWRKTVDAEAGIDWKREPDVNLAMN